MVMIVSCHFATHGGFQFDTKAITIPRLWWCFLEMGGNFGVDVFVLITGYFLVTDKGVIINVKKTLKFWGQVCFYSVVIYIVFGLIGISDLSLKGCIKTVFPITFGSWWFASTYFVLYLIHPFINILLQGLDKRTYKNLVVMELILWCIIPTFTTSSYQSNSLLWFVTLYCVAGYVRLYGLNPLFSTKDYVVIWIVFSALRYLSCVTLLIIGIKVPLVANNSLHFYGQQSVLTLVSSFALFVVFEKTNIGYNKWINTIATATFGVYLIHDNNLVRPFIWQDVFKNANYQSSLFLIPYSIVAIVAVYIACTVIDLLRQHIVERPCMTIVEKRLPIIIGPVKKIFIAVRDYVLGKD